MASRLQCLMYVDNTNRGATVDNFVEDWDPVGYTAWLDLERGNFATTDADGKIILTDQGKKEMERLRGQKES